MDLPRTALAMDEERIKPSEVKGEGPPGDQAEQPAPTMEEGDLLPSEIYARAQEKEKRDRSKPGKHCGCSAFGVVISLSGTIDA